MEEYDQQQLEKELAELENENSTTNQNQQQDNQQLDELESEYALLEKELNIDNEEKQQQSPIQKQVKKQKIIKLTLQEKEQKFHNENFYFGDCINVELEKIIPALKKMYENDDEEGLNLILFLSKKEKALITIVQLIQQQAEEGKIDQQKYIDMLIGYKNKNLQLLEQMKKLNKNYVSEQDLKRVQTRIKIITSELEGVQSSLEEDQNLQNQEEIIKQEDQKQDEQNEISKQEQTNDEEQEQVQQEVENKQEIKEENKSVSEDSDIDQDQVLKNPNYIYLNSKIQLFDQILDYLIENFEGERDEEIHDFQETHKKMLLLLKQMRKQGKKVSKSQIDKFFPTPKKQFIQGFTEQQKKSECRQIISDIDEEIKGLSQIKPKTANFCKQYYNALKKKLIEIMKQPQQKLPKVEKKIKEIQMKEYNKDIPDGSIGIKTIKVQQPKPNRFFCVQADIIYNDEFVGKICSNYCKQGGVIDNFQVVKINDSRLRPKELQKSRIKFTLYKRKFFFFSRIIGTNETDLNFFEFFANKLVDLKFEYKDKKCINVQVQISSHSNWGREGKTEVELLSITKVYEIFKPHQTKRDTQKISDQKNYQSEKQINNVIPPKKPKKKNDSKKPQKSYEQFAFPLLSMQDREILKTVVQKQKMPLIFLNFEEQIFSVTFLQELEQDLEKQYKFYSKNLDTEMLKVTNELLGKCKNYLTMFEEQMGSGQMTEEQYIGLVKNFVNLDKKILNLFQKMNLKRGILFIQKRLELMNKELEMQEG